MKRNRQGPRNTREQRPLPQTREVRIRTRKNRIPRGHHLERTCRDGPSKSCRDHRLARTQDGEGTTSLPRVLQFLLSIYQGFLSPRSTTIRTDQKRYDIQLVRQTKEGL